MQPRRQQYDRASHRVLPLQRAEADERGALLAVLDARQLDRAARQGRVAREREGRRVELHGQRRPRQRRGWRRPCRQQRLRVSDRVDKMAGAISAASHSMQKAWVTCSS